MTSEEVSQFTSPEPSPVSASTTALTQAAPAPTALALSPQAASVVSAGRLADHQRAIDEALGVGTSAGDSLLSSARRVRPTSQREPAAEVSAMSASTPALTQVQTKAADCPLCQKTWHHCQVCGEKVCNFCSIGDQTNEIRRYHPKCLQEEAGEPEKNMNIS